VTFVHILISVALL